jgi:hypothetical protein
MAASYSINASMCACNVLQVVCHHLSTRKADLIQAGCPSGPDDRSAFIFLPGGLGTQCQGMSCLNC